jgi:molybdopterin converting factor small subunit
LSVHVQLPPLLRNLCGGERSVIAEGQSVAAIAADLTKKHPAFALHIFDEAGAIRRNIVFLHDGALVRAGDAATHCVKDGDEVVLTNALAGG